jgi:hypothetical protein
MTFEEATLLSVNALLDVRERYMETYGRRPRCYVVSQDMYRLLAAPTMFNGATVAVDLSLKGLACYLQKDLQNL